MERETNIRNQHRIIIQVAEGFAEKPLFTAEGALREIVRLDQLKKEPDTTLDK